MLEISITDVTLSNKQDTHLGQFHLVKHLVTSKEHVWSHGIMVKFCYIMTLLKHYCCYYY